MLTYYPNSQIILIIYVTLNIDNWVDNRKIKGISYAGYSLVECGNSLVDILFGDNLPILDIYLLFR